MRLERSRSNKPMGVEHGTEFEIRILLNYCNLGSASYAARRISTRTTGTMAVRGMQRMRAAVQPQR